MPTRRAFLHATAATGAVALVETSRLRGQSKADQYDLVIRGGRVIDATRRLDALRDVAISDGKIYLRKK